LTRLVAMTASTLGRARPDRAGAGAAGGLGFAFLEYLGAVARPGVQIVAETVELGRKLIGADWVFTGEGSVDAQTILGKTPFGVAQIARRHHTPVIIFAGRVSADASILLEHGVDELITITPDGTPIEQALRDGPAFLAGATAEFSSRMHSRGA